MVKKILTVSLSVSGALLLVSVPALVSAGFLSDLLQKTAPDSKASDTSYNSQTLPLPTPATNLDPSPTLTASELVLVRGEAIAAQDNPLSPDDVQIQASNSQISVYIVRPGDTLSSIAAMFGVSTNTIVGANDIQKGVIKPGQELVILPISGIQHTVVKGETLTSLAKKYNSDAGNIALYNNLQDGAALTPGDTIIIPGGELVLAAKTTPTPSKTKTTAKTTKTTKSAKTAKTFTPAPLRNAGGPEYDDYYTWPVDGGVVTQSLHGYNGVDIGAPTGTNMFASAAGTVIIARANGAWNGGYGNYIVIAHDNGTQTLYAHASRVLVSAGQSVAKGQVIGKVGRTGESTGSHLHFEIRGATNPFGAIAVGGSGN